MQAKASLHLHTKEDFKDGALITYNIKQLIDQAVSDNFSVLAITGHEKCVVQPEHLAYARSRGVLLISGVELKIRQKHVLVLNCDASVEAIKSLAELSDFKKNHPEIMVIAPHPNHKKSSLGLRRLEEFKNLFDAIEHSWFYSKIINPNLRAAAWCQKNKKPFIATSDLHLIEYLNCDYAVLEINSLSVSDVFSAIRENKFVNISSPKSLTEMIFFGLRLLIQKIELIFKY